MRVAGMKPARDASAGLIEHDTLAADRPRTGQRPLVDGQALRELVDAALIEHDGHGGREPPAAPVAEIGLGRAEVLPVGLRLHADPLYRDGLALDPEQSLDHPLG